MTVSFHKYGEYFPGTGDLRVSLDGIEKIKVKLPNSYSELTFALFSAGHWCWEG